jgi:hypothetical protein
MSIAKKQRYKANSVSSRRKYPNGCVLPEKEIENFIGNLTVIEANAVVIHLGVIAEAAEKISRGEQPELNWRLIRKIAGDHKKRAAQQVMKAILAAVEQGGAGIEASRLTATIAYHYLFDYGPTRASIRQLHKTMLKRMRRTGKSGEPSEAAG